MHIIPNLKKLAVAARKHNVPVIYSNDAHLSVYEEVVERWGKHAIKGSKGAEVIPQLKPQRQYYVLEKRTFSGFHETGLEAIPYTFSWKSRNSKKNSGLQRAKRTFGLVFLQIRFKNRRKT
jgi:isochorismate hydrolase